MEGRVSGIAMSNLRKAATVLASAVASALLVCCASPTNPTASALSPSLEGPVIEIDDVRLFYELYDANDGRPTAEQLQRDYLDRGSAGLRIFINARNTTAERIAQAIVARPAIYTEARRCVPMLPRVRERAGAALRALRRLYPEARLPPVTIGIGRGRPMAIGSPATGVQIGLETLCSATFLNPNIEDLFVRVIAHEYAHVQQAPSLVDGQNLSVLQASVMEGAAEFVTELTTGDIGYAYLHRLTAGREREIETAFVADMDKTDLTDWVYNTTPEQPRELGYWVGYRIAKAYYRNAADKRRALREILQLEVGGVRALLEASGWRPGMTFD